MSDEEKKAIEKVKEAIRIDEERRITTIYDEKPLFREQLQTILNLIDKQQREIEHQREQRKLWRDNFYKQEKEIKELKKSFISKHKIREKIKELEVLYNVTLEEPKASFEMFYFIQSYIDKVKDILNELLEEN